MARSRKRRRRRSLWGLLVLLLLFLLFKLNPFLAGVLPGGGRWESDPRPDPIQQGMIQILVVRGPHRHPVEGARLRLSGLDGDRHNAQSDSEGKAEFKGLAAQPYRIDAEGTGDLASAWSEPGRAVTMEMRSRPVRAGYVRDEAGNPCKGVALLLDREAHVLAETEIQSNGRYTLPDHDHAVAVCVRPERGAPGATLLGDIEIGEGEQVRGRIPVPGIEQFDVFALIPDQNEDRLVPLRTQWKARRDGSYVGLLPKGARAWIVHEGAPYPVGMTAPVRKSASIEGVVTDIAQRPLAGIRVSARPLREGLPVRPFPLTRTATTGSDGTFRLEPLGEGFYSIELAATGLARSMIHEVATGSDPIAIVMTRGFRIRGRVLDPQGKPVFGAEVFALGTPDPGARYSEAATKTTSDGRFVLDRIGGEFARVRVRMDGYADATMMKVPSNGNVNIRLRREPIVSGGR